MKQITMIFLAVCLFLLPDFPMTVYAAEVERNRGLTVTDTEEYPELPEKSTAETTTKPENQTMNKKTGNLYIQNAGEGTGEKLSGAVFVIYRKGNKKITELTVKNGTTSLSLPEGEYYLMQTKAAPGYGVETARIYFNVITEGMTLVEVTSEIDLEHTNPQDLLPKTGENLPIRIYALSAGCFLLAVLCGIFLWRDRQKDTANDTTAP